jgi:hypothetical protein
VRLQFAKRCIPTRQGRGPTGDDKLPRYLDTRICRGSRTEVAVCVLPGTELAFDKEVKEGGFWLSKSTGQTTAVFRQLNKNIPGVFHDALEFADGHIVLLTRLTKGQHATVLQLPAVPSAKDGAKKEERT